jgi:hypothetical protein
MKIAPEDQKKVKALGVLGLMLLGAIYYSFFSGPSVPSYTPAPAQRAAVDNSSSPSAAEEPAPRVMRGARTEEFHPVLHSKRPENRVDPAKIDPRIQLYRLAKLQDVPPAGSGRNLFQFGAAPPPKVEAVKGPETRVVPTMGPNLQLLAAAIADAQPKPPVQPVIPPPAPFTPKYYGLATPTGNGRKRAFFLDGEDYIIKSEGETVKGHFRLVRISATSVVVEDTDNKRQQTVQIAEDAQG